MPQSTDPLPQQPSFAADAARFDFRNAPITAPGHLWLTSPACLHTNASANGLTAQAKELPLHLILLILTHVPLAMPPRPLLDR